MSFEELSQNSLLKIDLQCIIYLSANYFVTYHDSLRNSNN